MRSRLLSPLYRGARYSTENVWDFTQLMDGGVGCELPGDVVHLLSGITWNVFLCLQNMVASPGLDHVYIAPGSGCQIFAFTDYTVRETKTVSHILPFTCSFPCSFKRNLLTDNLVPILVPDSKVSKLHSMELTLEGPWIFYILSSKTNHGFFLYLKNPM